MQKYSCTTGFFSVSTPSSYASVAILTKEIAHYTRIELLMYKSALLHTLYNYAHVHVCGLMYINVCISSPNHSTVHCDIILEYMWYFMNIHSLFTSCLFRCVFRCIFWLNLCPHILQVNGFSPVWTRRCLCSQLGTMKLFPHIGQVWHLPLCGLCALALIGGYAVLFYKIVYIINYLYVDEHTCMFFYDNHMYFFHVHEEASNSVFVYITFGIYVRKE